VRAAKKNLVIDFMGDIRNSRRKTMGFYNVC